MTTPLNLPGGGPEGLEPPTGSVVGEGTENAIELREVAGLSQGQIVRRRFVRHRGAIIGLGVLGALVLLAYSSVGAFGITGWWDKDPNELADVVNGSHPTMQFPVWLNGSGGGWFYFGPHPFGQDNLGHDIFARAMKGAQTSINVMVVLAIVAAVVGVGVGALAGYFRGWTDQVLMRITDLVITFPVLVVGAVLGKLVQNSGWFLLALALGLITWTTLARLVRGEFLALREREFVDAARVAGASPFRIMFKHMLPNAMGVVVVNTTLLMSTAVLLETSLSFLQFGIKEPQVSLGKMIADNQGAFDTRPWLFWWPAFFIVVIALSVNFVGDGLRDAFDPRQKKVPSASKMAKAERAEAAEAAKAAASAEGAR